MLSPRTQSLVAMLGSPNDGEALNAARKLANALKSEGFDFYDLARGVGSKPEPVKARGWKADVVALRALGEDHFSVREWDFLENLLGWSGKPTERQAKWLADLKLRELG